MFISSKKNSIDMFLNTSPSKNTDEAQFEQNMATFNQSVSSQKSKEEFDVI